MPLLKHARKKLRQDKKRTIRNKQVKNLFKSLVKKAKENPSAESISAAVSAVDKAAKNHIIHENKAAHMKASLAKIAPAGAASKKTEAKKTETKVSPKPTKKKTTTKKAPAKSAKK